MEDEQKRALIESRRGTLEHELYAAELDLKVAKATEKDELIAGPAARLEVVKAQLKVLDDEAAALG